MPAMLRRMGFELETETPMERPIRIASGRHADLERRWQRACEDIESATAELRALAGDPQAVVRCERVQARLAAARRRRIELAEDLERLEAETDDGDIWR